LHVPNSTAFAQNASIRDAGQDASSTVSVTFDLYGSSVEPFDGTKTKAVQTAIAQSAGKWCQRLQPLAVSQGRIQLDQSGRYTRHLHLQFKRI